MNIDLTPAYKVSWSDGMWDRYVLNHNNLLFLYSDIVRDISATLSRFSSHILSYVGVIEWLPPLE